MPTCRYHYDALDRLAARTDVTQDTTRHFYQASRLATAIGKHLQRTILATDRQLLAQKDVSTAGERSYLLATDQQDSVLRAASVGQRIDIAYSPYGHRQDPGPLPGFNGQDSDPLTGHYLLGNGYRAFNPLLKRFNSPDSLSPFGEGGLNAYAYCQGDPVNRSDPSGHVVAPFIWIGLGLANALWSVKLAAPGIKAIFKGTSTLSQKLSVASAVTQLTAGTIFATGRVIAAADPDSTAPDATLRTAIALGFSALGMRVSSRYVGKWEVRAREAALARSLEQRNGQAVWHTRLQRRIEFQAAQLPAQYRLQMALAPWRREWGLPSVNLPDSVGMATRHVQIDLQRQREAVSSARLIRHRIRHS